MSIRLPEHATEASKRRAELAEQLAQSCPPDLADEIALVGSTARGYADDDSDLELNLWAEKIPPLEARIAWLQAADASEIEAEKIARRDQSHWLHGKISDIPFEVGWQTFDTLNSMLDHLHSGAFTDRKAETFADIVVSAVPLRTSGGLRNWQTLLNNYSDAVLPNVIQQAVDNWSQPQHFLSERRLAQHGERFMLTKYFLADFDLAVSIIYAVNRRWQPSPKWTLTVVREFAPFDLDARIDAILGDPSLERRVDLCAQLCLDVLALVPKDYDVSAAVKTLKEALK